MNTKFLVSTLATAVALSFTATAMAKDTSDKEQRFEQITVIGSQQAITTFLVRLLLSLTKNFKNLSLPIFRVF